MKGRETIEIARPAGEEIQWDWAERRNSPWGATCYGLLSTLAYSGRTREVLKSSMDQPHLIEAIDSVLRRLGGPTRNWRTDRLATVIRPGSSEVQASFAPVEKHYGAVVVACPSRRNNRKGAVECGVKFMCGRWWRPMTAITPEDAQLSLDRFWATTGDARLRPPGRYVDPDGAVDGGLVDDGLVDDGAVDGMRPVWPIVAELTESSRCSAPVVPFPATVSETHRVDVRASLAFRGNRCSVGPGLGGADLAVRHQLGTNIIDVLSPAGQMMVTHSLRAARRRVDDPHPRPSRCS